MDFIVRALAGKPYGVETKMRAHLKDNRNLQVIAFSDF